MARVFLRLIEGDCEKKANVNMVGFSGFYRNVWREQRDI